MTTTHLIPATATHPGEILADEIDANGFSQIDFANLIGLKRSQLNEIIKGKRNINADLALLLEKALDIDAAYWLEAQKNYDLDKARIDEKNKKQLEAIEIWNVIKGFIPVSFFKKEQIITGNPVRDNQVIREIYRINQLDDLAIMRVQPNYTRFKKSIKLKADLNNIMGWVKLVQFKAEEVQVVPFSHEVKDSLIKQLRQIFQKNKNVLSSVQNLLHENGIKLIYQSKGEKTPVDGVSFWSNGNPAIGMTLRHKRLDNFAFTLFHELGHVFEHLINNNQAEFIDLDVKNEDDDYKNLIEEKEANNFAESALINDTEWNAFIKTVPLYYSDAEIKSFAKKIQIHPCIVRGRVCHVTKNYKSFTSISHEIN